MKSHFIIYLLGFTTFVLLLYSCSKDESINPNSYETLPDPQILSIIQNINSDSIQSYVQALEDMGTRFALANNRKQVATSILNKFKHFGYTDVRLDSFLLIQYYNGINYSTWQYNVIATLHGTIYPDSVSIIGGHHDCIVRSGTGDPFTFAPGANDNASGVATTLEIARVLKFCNFTPKISIGFITFASEELGLHGSWDFATKARDSNQNIKMMLNNDMVAYWSDSDTSNWCVNILDYENSVNLRLNAQNICKVYSTLKTNNNNDDRERSDSYPFSCNGFKAIFFTSNANDVNYHTINDLTSACNFKFCREIAKVNCVLLIQNNFAN